MKKLLCLICLLLLSVGMFLVNIPVSYAEVDGSGLLIDYVGTNNGAGVGGFDTSGYTSTYGVDTPDPAQDIKDRINEELGNNTDGVQYYDASADIKNQINEALQNGGSPKTDSASGDTSDSTVANENFNDTKNVGENFCSEPAVRNVLRFFGIIILLLKYFVPIIIIAKGTFLFYNAVVKDGSDQLTKSAKELGMKIILGILIFFIPSMVSGILHLYDGFFSVSSEFKSCANCLIDPSKC